MGDWKTGLKADATEWLLEEDNPSVRYFALKDLLDKPEDDEAVRQAKKMIMRTGDVPKILARQYEPEYAASYKQFYKDKYKGIVWQLIVLAELGASVNDSICNQCEYLFSHSQEPESGGFSFEASAKSGGGLKSGVIPCLTGNMVWALIKFGYIRDKRLISAMDWITRYQRFDDGDGDVPKGYPYERYEMCWGRHTCHMGVVKTLKALAAVPEEHRTQEIQETIKNAVEYLLIHHIYKRSHNLREVSKPGWLKFGFPLMYQTDVLEILDIFTALGIKDSRMEEALALVLSKQDDNGRWHLMNTYNDRLLVPIEKKNTQSKWVTLRALRVLKRYDEGRR